MQLTSRLIADASERHRAGDILGPAHPLVRTLNASAESLRQTAAVGVMFLAGAMATADGVAVAMPLTVAAGIVVCCLSARVAVLAVDQRRRAVDLIADGDGGVRVRVVERAAERLRESQTRELLARSLETMCADAATAPWTRTRPIYNVRTCVAATPQLVAVARLLRDPDARVRGVAMTERLLCEAGSPLYGTDATTLQEELGRIGFHLAVAWPCDAPGRVEA